MSRKQYGKHKYPDGNTTSDCIYGCGCWVGSSRSDGPIGLDPLSGNCPKNPIDGLLLGGQKDYEEVVKQRIADLEDELSSVKTQLSQVAPDKLKLAQELVKTKRELSNAKRTLKRITDIVKNN